MTAQVIEHDAPTVTLESVNAKVDEIHSMLTDIHTVLAPLLPMVANMTGGDVPANPLALMAKSGLRF